MGRSNWLSDWKPVLGMVGLMFVYAGVTLLSKAALVQGMNTRVFIVYRQAFASLVLVPAAIIKRRGQKSERPLGIKSFCYVFLSSLLGVTVFQNVYFIGLGLASSSIASTMFNLTPAITMVMATSIGLEKIKMNLRSLAKIIGTVISVGGAITMTLFKGPQLLNMGSPSIVNSAWKSADERWTMGCLLLFGAICLWSLWLTVQAPLCKNYFDPPSLSAWMSILSFLQSALLAFILEPSLKAWRLNTRIEFICCLYTGIVGTGVTYYVQTWCISRRGPVFAAIFFPLFTVITTIVAFLLLHEKIYVGSLVGAAAVVSGLYIVLWGKAKDGESEGRAEPQNGNIRIVVSTEKPSTSCYADMKKPLLDDV